LVAELGRVLDISEEPFFDQSQQFVAIELPKLVAQDLHFDRAKVAGGRA
jgi:hypothetical protein